MGIYTKTGDCGQTSLASGERVAKNSARLEAYGELDELNAAIGLALSGFAPELDADKELLTAVQKDIFTISSWLACTPQSPLLERLPKLSQNAVTDLENAIDRLETATGPLRKFILPGGSESAARLHLARTICRRAERRTVTVEEQSAEFALICAFVNRLSDYLFALARFANYAAGMPDTEV